MSSGASTHPGPTAGGELPGLAGARAGAAALLLVGAADLLFLNGWVFPRVFAPPGPAPFTAPDRGGDRLAGPRPAVSVARVPGAGAPAAIDSKANSLVQPSVEPLPRMAMLPEAQRPASERVIGEARLRRLRQVYFPRNVHELDESGVSALKALADRAAQASATIVIDGHADQTGPEVFNGWLSEQRAVTVADRLAALGVPRDRIVIRHFGSSRPAVPGADGKPQRRNRRVEIALAQGGIP